MKRGLIALPMVLLLSGCMTERPHRVKNRAPQPQRETVDRQSPKNNQRLIRVAILTRQHELRLQAPENFIMTGFRLGTSTETRSVTLTVQKLSASKARLQTLGRSPVKVNGQSYLGALEILPDKGGTLTVVNELGLEDYVQGVLLGEVPRDWPLEALKAQAIAARTFAMLKRTEARNACNSWDIENHALFQVYKGSSGVSEPIRQAVAKTRGQVLTWKRKLLTAVYHSNCGGRTCQASNVWGKDEPYLKVVDCHYCREGPHFSWKVVVPHAEITKKLRASGLQIGDLADLQPMEWDETNRITKIVVIDSEGRRLEMRGNAFRNALGPDLVRCTRFEVEMVVGGFEFKGQGWGHGVGMCQEGAWGMAREGFRASEILRKYYPGSLIEDLDGL
jgi:stage II sporulation protein D